MRARDAAALRQLVVIACSGLGKVVSERIQDLIGGLGPVNGRGLAFGMS
jgi:hypothetical protein